MEEPTASEFVVAKSAVWRTILRDIVETARFSDATVLIQGETGTGKEIVARLIHLLDSRPDKRDLSLVGLALAASEFGHQG